MIRFLFRFIGLWLLAGAFVALVIDGTRSVAASRIVLTTVGEAWSVVHRPSLELFRAHIVGNYPAWVWDPVAIDFLLAPLWIALGRARNTCSRCWAACRRGRSAIPQEIETKEE